MTREMPPSLGEIPACPAAGNGAHSFEGLPPPVSYTPDCAAHGWFKAMRSDVALELIKANPSAFILAYVIASRARWHDGFNAAGLNPGEALLGDYVQYGMTRQNYRTALAFLEKSHFATIKSTNRGTVAKLTDTRLFDVLNTTGNQQSNQQPTSGQPTGNHQLTNSQPLTKKERRPEGKKEEQCTSKASLKLAFGAVDFPESLSSDEFKTTWNAWVQHLREKGTKTTPSAFKKQIEKCAEIGETGAIAAINHSISNNWQGIFEPRERGSIKPLAPVADYSKGF